MITHGPGRILIADKPAIDCTVEDWSICGARLRIGALLCIPDLITLDFAGTRMRARVAWRSRHEVGIAFAIK